MVAALLDVRVWTVNDDAALGGGVCSSLKVVAGTGFEPVTFRL
jgi:site-specific DNA recombinase